MWREEFFPELKNFVTGLLNRDREKRRREASEARPSEQRERRDEQSLPHDSRHSWSGARDEQSQHSPATMTRHSIDVSSPVNNHNIQLIESLA